MQAPVPASSPASAPTPLQLREVADERDRLYMALFDAEREARKASVEAMKLAVDKAEGAQREYNAKTNEIRAQLNDQAITFMPRKEAEAMYEGLTDRLNRETSRGDKGEGRSLGVSATGAGIVAAISVLASIVAIFIAIRK